MKALGILIVLPAFFLAACASHSAAPVENLETPAANLSTSATQATAQPANPVTRTPDEEIEKQIFERLNQERAAAGAPPLTLASGLTVATRQHSASMRDGNFISTRGNDEDSLIVRMHNAGISTLAVGEDVMRFQGRSYQVAREAVSNWLATPPDRLNMVSKNFQRVGIGVTHDKNGVYYVTADFAE